VKELIPSAHRISGIESYWDQEKGWNDTWNAFSNDEFALDASRVTLAVGHAGYDGDTFKNEVLMNRHGIQINKTSRNTVLFMTNIGTTRSSVAYLIEVLVKVAQDLDSQLEDASGMERRGFDRRVKSLIHEYPPLPDFSRFHDAFRSGRAEGTAEGDLRSAYFMAYEESNCDYFPLEDGSMEAAMDAGRELVSTAFIIPYPPGFPILVPGQVISKEILHFMRALDVKEIHGYRPDLGLRVFTDDALASASAAH
jgi:arginine decarboxylase